MSSTGFAKVRKHPLLFLKMSKGKGAQDSSQKRASGGNKQNDGALAGDVRLSRIEQTSFIDLNPEDAYALLVSKAPSLKSFESFWRSSGVNLIQFGARNFVQNMQLELPMMSRSLCIELFGIIQNKIKSDVSTSPKDTTPQQHLSILEAWINAPQPLAIVHQEVNESNGSQSAIHPVDQEIAALAAMARGRSRAADALISATATAMGTGLWTLDQDLAKAHKGAVLLR